MPSPLPQPQPGPLEYTSEGLVVVPPPPPTTPLYCGARLPDCPSFGDNIAVVHGLSLHSFSQASFARRRSHRAPIAGRSPATRCSRSMCFAANQASSNPVSPVLVSFCAALLLRCCLQHRRACNRVRNQVRETFVFCTAWRFEWLGSHNGAALAAPSTGAGAGGGDELALLATPLHVQAGTSFMGGARASVTKIRHSGAGTRGVAV